MYQDLRSFLQKVKAEAPGEMVQIRRPVSTVHEAPAVVARMYKEGRFPIALFEAVEGHSIPLVYNLGVDLQKVALALDVPVERATETFAHRMQQRRPAVRVHEGPVQEVVQIGDEVDLMQLPIVTHSELDDAPYITLGVTVCRDADKYNLGIYRHRLWDRNHLGIYYSWGKRLQYIHQRAEERGEPLEVAIILGGHPMLMYGSIAASAAADDEYEVAGGLLNESVPLVRCKTVDLEVPANAEIVIEGRILPGVRKTEGPFGEYTDYYGQIVDAPVVEVTAITRRHDAIYPDVGMNVEHCHLSNLPRAAQLLGMLRKAVPTVREVHIPTSGTSFHAYISMKKRNEGDPKNVMMVALGMDPFLKHVVVVDEEIDVYDEREVLWAIATRFRADRDMFMVEGARGNRLDPTTYTITRMARDGMVTKLGLDATVPLGLPYELPKRMYIPGTNEIRLSDYLEYEPG